MRKAAVTSAMHQNHGLSFSVPCSSTPGLLVRRIRFSFGDERLPVSRMLAGELLFEQHQHLRQLGHVVRSFSKWLRPDSSCD